MSLGAIDVGSLTQEENVKVITAAFAAYLLSTGMDYNEMLNTMAKWCAIAQESIPGRPQ